MSQEGCGQRPSSAGVRLHGKGTKRSVDWENGDELPDCFLERGRFGCPLPCAIRLRTQRSDHMAVGCDGSGQFAGAHARDR